MFRNLFGPNSGLMIFMTHLTDLIFLSVFWLLCCFPVVTIGPACAALYDAAVRTFRRGEEKPWTRFWHSFRQNVKVGIPATIVWGAATAALGYGMIQVWNGFAGGTVSQMVFAAVFFLGFLAMGILSVMFPLLSRFETTLGQLISNTLRLGIANLPRTLGLAAVTAGSAVLCVRFVWPLFILPCCGAWLASFCVEPMLKPFMPQPETQEADS